MPDRRDLVWLDSKPTRGKEIGKYRPAIVVSSREYNRKSGLLICCPVSTSIRGTATEVSIRGLDKPSVVAASLVQTLSWREFRVQKIKRASSQEFKETLLRVLPLIGAAELLESA